MPPISVTIFASDPGNYFLEDNGIPGDNFSRIRFPDGTTVSFEHPTDDLFFDPSVAGVSLTVNLTDSLGTSRFSTGDLLDPAQTPDAIILQSIRTTAGVTLISNGSITEAGADAGADIIASTLVMSAVTGIGTPGNALETQVGVLEAETTTGGINIGNFGTVSIGGLTADVDGLDVVTSGDLTFTTFGSMVLSDESGPETVHGGTTSGNVTLSAVGVDTDLIANVDQDSISAPHGDITVAAGRDIGFGLIGSNFDNDVRASGTVTFNSGRDVLLDGFADIASDNFGNATGGNVVFNAGRNVTLLAVAGTDAGVEASGISGADVILNTGPGGTVTLNSGNGTAPFASLISQTGDVIVNADRMLIGANGAISTPSGEVLLQTRTFGWQIILGSASDAAFAMELSDAELDRIFTPTLTIGSASVGQLSVIAAISPLHAPNLTLRGGEDVAVQAAITTTTSLSLRAGNNLFELAAATITTGTFSALVDQVGLDGNTGGFGILNGTVTAATSATLTGDSDADTLIGSGANETLNGGAGNDTLSGRAGIDFLNGGPGTDTMIGGLGNDTYVVDNAGDVVTEAVGEGTDTIQTALAAYNITGIANLENLTGTSGAGQILVGNALANTIKGGGGSDTLDGLGNDDTLDGGGGIDTLFGGFGNDTFIVHNSATGAIENPGQGTDVVQADVSYMLGSNVENLTLTGGAAINGTGNGADNSIAGNAAANVLDGLFGEDLLFGGGGNDILLGNSLGDLLFGSTEDDTYVINNFAAPAIENPGEGTDTVQSSVNYMLGSNVENLTLTGGAAINGTGNGAGNSIAGNGAANVLDGLFGEDLLFGGGGNDILLGNSLGDLLFGSTEDDTYVINNFAAPAIENPGEGTDTVQSSVSYSLGSNVENLTLTGGAAINGTGNAAANRFEGNSSNNIFIGNGGADRFVFAAAGTGLDTINDFDAVNASGGHDLIDLSGRGLSFGALGISQVGADVRIVIGADQITLKSTLLANVDAGDFLF